MGHPELLDAMSGPLPPPPAEDPELDCGPMEDGNALPSILRDFRQGRILVSTFQLNLSTFWCDELGGV